MDTIHVIIEIDTFEEMWAVPINRLGTRELETYRNEKALAAALREIADEIEKGMSFQASGDLGVLL